MVAAAPSGDGAASSRCRRLDLALQPPPPSPRTTAAPHRATELTALPAPLLLSSQENLAELFGGGAAARKGTVSPGRMDLAKRRAVKEMEANAKVASAAAGVGQEVREAKVLKEMQDLEINEEEIMETSMLNDSVRYGGVVPSSPSQWEVRPRRSCAPGCTHTLCPVVLRSHGAVVDDDTVRCV